MKKTILIVDDSVVRSLLKDTLEEEYHVLEASTCQEVIEQLTNPIDLALIEFILPDAYGSEVLNEIRKAKPEIPIIMTGYGGKPALKALGNVDYIKKPFQLAYLRKRVSEKLGGSV
jgi:DNA-binding NtrC family response regulator